VVKSVPACGVVAGNAARLLGLNGSFELIQHAPPRTTADYGVGVGSDANLTESRQIGEWPLSATPIHPSSRLDSHS
jgi:hypothetical protein